ncbi:proprotein convertase subtilisin/kexin type 5-like [Asterias rubens]|uniref:proprotein convertase subtilisin/kexin type 5-like n=1 Tax=Asterias rubens TaxID=7604 RepID=UPI00145548BB|nr:proprotein convertase subtilisin/kexin type 5-like [Asterias rubens]
MDWCQITSVSLMFIFGLKGIFSTYTNEFVANIEGGEEVADLLARRYGFINGGQMENLKDHYVLYHRTTQKRSISPSRGDHTAIKHEAAVNWIDQQVIRTRVKRDTDGLDNPNHSRQSQLRGHTRRFNDPKYVSQWYMNRQNAPNMNVETAWDLGYTGKGIVVSILDDGIDYTHPDLVNNYDPAASRDINGKDDDPMPRANYDQTNRHGTRCAGEVAMEAGNDVCGVGVAYNASIGGIRMLDDQVTDKTEGDSLLTYQDHIDIFSASWGPEDDGMTVDGPGRLAQRAFLEGVTKGRGGKGNIFVWASGNGGRSKDNCGCDGYTNSIYTISISSTSERGEAPWYLEECASTLATTYSSGSSRDKKVITTDLGGRCTDDHTGTSASAPMAAGICALALQANYNMTWRDIQYIIVMTSRHTGLEDKWTTNGAGYAFGHRYGYGLMDAGAMVELAQSWTNVPTQRTCQINAFSGTRDLKGRGLLASFTLDTTACSGPNHINYLEHVQSTINVTYGYRGALVLTLISPMGTHSTLLDRRPRDSHRGSFSSWPFMSTHFWGERASGVWTLEVRNGSPRVSSGMFQNWILTLHGTETLPRRVDSYKRQSTRSDSSGTYGSTGDDGADHSHSLADNPTNWNDEYYGTCHSECFNGCDGPLASDCYKCLHYRDRNTDECVKHCPDVGFFEPPNHHQKCKACSASCLSCVGYSDSDCLSCKDLFFLMESSSQCVLECEDGFFKDIETKKCMPCDPLCSKCEDSAMNCEVCEPGAVLTIYNSCQLSCSVNQYLNSDNKCQQCNNICYTCSGGGTQECLSCVPGFALQDRTCIEESECVDGNYVSRSPDTQCLKCHVSCKECNGPNSDDCQECDDPFILNEEGKCVRNCENGYFRKDNGYCYLCPSDCDQCRNASTCMECKPEFVLKGGNCEQGCGAKSYEHEGICLSCHAMCQTCTGGGPQDCTTCIKDDGNTLYLLEGACVPFCPPDRYKDTTTSRCEECDETCQTCKGPDVNDCTECYEGFTGPNDQGFCSEDPSRYCDSKCKECTKASDSNCSSCHEGKLLYNADCVDSCPERYYQDENINECQLCHPSCQTCSGSLAWDCLTCPDEEFLHSDNTCDAHCPYSTYADQTDKMCKPCFENCLTCRGPGFNDCETCTVDYFWQNNQCVQSCEDGTYGDFGMQECLQCFPSCRTCTGPFSTDCLSCPTDLNIKFGSCVSNCESRTYLDTNGNCEDCHYSCLTCTGPSATECQTCDYDRFLDQDQSCQEECAAGYYPNYVANMCQKCHSSCHTCVQGGAEDCMDCTSDKYFLSQEDGVYCVDRCPEGYYELDEGAPQDISHTCQLCSFQCLDCYQTYSQCVSCKDNTFLFREQCVPSCPEGFVEDLDSNQCIAEDRKCPLNCQDCNEWGECQKCEDTFDIYYGECLRRPCADSQYQALNDDGMRECRSCFENCSRCLGPRSDECLECHTNYKLDNGECSRDCGPQQFDREGICLACHPSCNGCSGASPYDCMECPDGAKISAEGDCIIGCPDNTYQNGGDCLRCDSSCATCDGEGDHRCISCPSLYYLTGDQMCVQSCPDGTFHYHSSSTADEFECRPCHSNCKNCYGPTVRECTSCHDNMYKLAFECVLHCGRGFFPGPGSICQPCHTDCSSCWGSGVDQCISCTKNFKVMEGSCVEDCPADYYYTSDFIKSCEPCHIRCKTCNDMGPFNCLTCKDGYELEDNVCYSKCDLGSYYANDTCNKCDSTCQECYGPTDTHCLKCNEGQSLSRLDANHTTCLSCCKDGQSSITDNCCECKDGKCPFTHGDPGTTGPVVDAPLNTTAILVLCLLIVAVFGLFFGILQARSRKMFCWKNDYDQLPTFYNNKGEEPQIVLRQNAIPSDDEDDYFYDDDDSDI